jgi:hypothetical protein
VNTQHEKTGGCENNGWGDFFTIGLEGETGNNGEDYRVIHTHLPSIDRDSSERLYHYLFNYETCKEIYGDDVPSCDWSKINDHLESWDENDYPTHPETGITDFPRHEGASHPQFGKVGLLNDANGRGEPVYSRKYCEAFWEAYEDEYGEYDWTQEFAFQLARDNPVKYGDEISFDYETVTGEEKSVTVKFDTRMGGLHPEGGLYSVPITSACIFWYEPFLDEYYDESEQNPIPWYVGQILPPWADYYRYYLHIVRGRGTCGSDGKRQGPLADSDYPDD